MTGNDEDSTEVCGSSNEDIKIKDIVDISGSNKDITDVPVSNKDLKKKGAVLKKNISPSSKGLAKKKVKNETKSEIPKQDTTKKEKGVRHPMEPTKEGLERRDDDSREVCVSGNEDIKNKDITDISGSNKDITYDPGSNTNLKKKGENIRPVLKKIISPSYRGLAEEKVEPETKSEISKQETTKKMSDRKKTIEPR